ncbi:hypothetical protein AVEN_260231-1 [Araneus ventricosus]|uniref:Uncharacterized protein n=1 Tax=Araneus ventricosus TaxID=182803 RepID=A0A4Y2W6I3_ARAVE|nr:hypothetical protein AVEN_260231-1 [Araneus ventricosus]
MQCIQVVVYKCAVSTLKQGFFSNCVVKFVVTTSQQTCFASGLVDYALLLCRKFASKLQHQVCHDKLISRKILLQVYMLSGIRRKKQTDCSQPIDAFILKFATHRNSGDETAC